MLLSVRKRQEYLTYLGFYDGAIDNVEGPYTRAAYKALQKEYFTREKDIDGKYGSNTEKLLLNAYYVKKYTKNFKLEEFKCDCGGKYCTGYPAVLSIYLLENIQAVRDEYGPTTITSGMRCKGYNRTLKGSSKTSRHLKGWALDFFVEKCKTLLGRTEVMTFWRKRPNYNYTYCNVRGSHPNMGNCIHGDVKK